MIRLVRLVALSLALTGAARAQDVQGIELCTREASMERRTGCLQSNVNLLQQMLTKATLEARQRQTAAGNEIAALKSEIAALKTLVSGLQKSVEQLQAAQKAAGDKKPESKNGK